MTIPIETLGEKELGSKRLGASLTLFSIFFFPGEYFRIPLGHSDHCFLKPNSNFSSLRTDQVYR